MALYFEICQYFLRILSYINTVQLPIVWLPASVNLLIQYFYLIYHIYSHFVNCPNNVSNNISFFGIGSYLRADIAFS